MNDRANRKRRNQVRVPLISAPTGWLRRLYSTFAPAVKPTRMTPVPHVETHRLPLYMQADHGRLHVDGDLVRLTRGEAEPQTARLADISEVILMGQVSVTTPCLHRLMRDHIPVSWHTSHGWFLGHTMGFSSSRLSARLAQYRGSQDAKQALSIACALVAAKIYGCHLILRRNHKGLWPRRFALSRLAQLESQAMRAEDVGSLLGIEGAAAAAYFKEFPSLIRSSTQQHWARSFPGRRRRPPTDPVNAALSFAYALLVRSTTVSIMSTGLDCQLGFLHQPRDGRPSLALDLMEPLRPLVADSIVLRAINARHLRQEDFTSSDTAVLLNQEGKRKLISAFERRLGEEISHPLFGRPITYRQWPYLQARLLVDMLTGARSDFPQLRPR